MKILVADKLAASGLAALDAHGFEVAFEPDLKDDALVARIADSGAKILVVRSTRVTRPALEAGALSLVIRAGAGFNTIDVAAAAQLGIYVANCPGRNAIAVAELTWGLILSLDRRIPDCVAALRRGEWNKKEFSRAAGLHGRTLGIVGLGAIGVEVAARASAFGMPVVAWSRSLTPERAEALDLTRAETPEEVAAKADIVSIHLALTEATRHRIGWSFFEAMREGALLVNTSRGDLIDPEALRRAIADKGIRAGLDVWTVQPGDPVAPFEDPLGQLDAVYGTHHIGASTQQAQEAVAAEVARIASVYKASGRVPGCVNLCESSPAAGSLVVRHLDRVGVLAFVLDQLRRADVNVHEMQNVLFEGEGAAACATIRLATLPPADVLEALRAHPHVIHVEALATG